MTMKNIGIPEDRVPHIREDERFFSNGQVAAKFPSRQCRSFSPLKGYFMCNEKVCNQIIELLNYEMIKYRSFFP